jgi:type 1 glutamine amidotransferase
MLSNENEPMDWIRVYGKGRVYSTMLGHTWTGEPTTNLDCVGFQTLLARGAQWGCYRCSYDSYTGKFSWAGLSFTPQADLRGAICCLVEPPAE